MASNNADFGCTFFIRQANGQAYDLTGASLEMSVKNRAGTAAQATFATSGASPNLVVRSPAAAGIVDLYVPFQTMAGLPAGLYFWDLLALVSGTSRIFLGGGTWLVTQGITESATPSLPAPSPYPAASGSDLALMLAGQSLTLNLAPQGPPGTGASFAPQAAPAPPAEGYVIFCDQADGLLKAIDSSGDTGVIPLT
jgi:hypothetical protein